MEFLAEFSFKEKMDKQFGSFRMMVSAASPAEAFDKFYEEIMWIKKYGINEEDLLFKDTKEIHLESIIQIEKMPIRPAMTHFELDMTNGYVVRNVLLSSDSNLSSLKYTRKKEGNDENEDMIFIEFD